jgi:hypothetical protein
VNRGIGKQWSTRADVEFRALQAAISGGGVELGPPSLS